MRNTSCLLLNQNKTIIFSSSLKLLEKLPFAPKSIDVAIPAKNELIPSSFARTCSTMHSNKTNIPPNEANPLAVPIIRRMSLLRTIGVDLLIFPI